MNSTLGKLLVGFVLLTAVKLPAQIPNQQEYTQAIKLNVISPFLGCLTAQYENKLNENSSLVFTGSYLNGQNDIIEKVQGYSISAEYRFYAGKAHMDGFYFQPYGRYQYYKSTQQPGNELTIPGIGLLFGFQKKIIKNIVFDVYYGPAYNFGTFTYSNPNGVLSYTSSDVPPMYNGYWMRGGIAIGLLFK